MTRRGVFILAGAALAGVTLLTWLFRPARPGPAVEAFPSFAAAEAGGGAVTDADLRGRPWLASFVFTRCAGPCPRITARVAALQDKTPAALRLVTFTVDPDHDTPAVLREYAARFGADPARWIFLQVDSARLSSLMYEGFRLPYGKSPNPAPGFEVIHTAKLVLVGPDGRVAGYFDSDDVDLPALLDKALRSFL